MNPSPDELTSQIAALDDGRAIAALRLVLERQGQPVNSIDAVGTDTAVVTVGAMRAGTKENIPDNAELLVSIRTVDGGVRSCVLDGIERIVRAEAAASGATREPQVQLGGSLPVVVNGGPASARTLAPSPPCWARAR